MPPQIDRFPTPRHAQPIDRPGASSLRRAEEGLRAPTAITLLEMEPELRRLLTSEQCAAAQRLLLPLATVEKNGDLSAVIGQSDAFGALVLDGLALQTVHIDTLETLSLIGPGALVPVERQADWMPPISSHVKAATETRIVMLGKALLVAAQRWPWVVVCLHERMLEQSARLTKQLAISQMPRVEERVVAMLKLLAESWGRVTPAGIRLQLSFTHETLGGLIGARRPTVSLAFKALADRNAVTRCDGGWLISGQ